MSDAKKTTSKPATKKPASREEILAIHMSTRPTGNRGRAKRRVVPNADATRLSVKAHPRCSRRGIKLWGVHFTAGESIDLEIAKLPPGIANRICRHPELVVIEYQGKDRLTPERAVPKPPQRRVAGSVRLRPSTPRDNVAGPASVKRRRASGKLPDPKPPTKGSGGATNHPKPAAPESGAKPKK